MKVTEGALAFSYGIEERDMWSETMSNMFHVSPRLFDCFVNPDTSPPMAKTAPSGTGPGGCQSIQGICYEMPYESSRTCLGPSAKVIEGHNYATLHSHLQGRAPLSTYVKIDVEGSEWTVLERLLDSAEDQDVIRTLDMEVHVGFRAASDEEGGMLGMDQRSVEREVRVMERLLEHFDVTGTTLEQYRQGWTPERDCPTRQCEEPSVHTSGAFGVRQFAVSYVNRRLLPKT